MSLVRVATPRVSSPDASRWRRLSNDMAAVRAKVSGGAAAEQLKYELAVLTEALFLLCVSTCDRHTCKHTCF